jgi:hypothetical protein
MSPENELAPPADPLGRMKRLFQRVNPLVRADDFRKSGRIQRKGAKGRRRREVFLTAD